MQKRKNLPIPDGWALDADGNVTTDATKAFEAGKLLPLGGDEKTSSYKGTPSLSFSIPPPSLPIPFIVYFMLSPFLLLVEHMRFCKHFQFFIIMLKMSIYANMYEIESNNNNQQQSLLVFLVVVVIVVSPHSMIYDPIY